MSELLLTAEARLAPGHTALLVIDMQNDFCAEGGYVEKVVGKDASACRAVAELIMDLVARARDAGVPVYWLIADYSRDKVPEGMRVRAAARGGNPPVCCAPGSWGAEFFGVAPLSGEPVVVKHNYSGFIGTDLEPRLRRCGVRTIVLAGVQTNVCVESTLRDGFGLGFHTVLASDCVASHTAELHEATIKNAVFLFGDVLPRAGIAAIWQAHRRAA
jgi:ureidoacrylate peracid hydrolase